MTGEDDRLNEATGTPPVGRYEREVEAHFRGSGAGMDAPTLDSGEMSAARHWKAALSWLLFLVVIVGLALLVWPRIAPLMHRSVAPTTPPRQAGAPATPFQAPAPARAKRPVRDYPPCTATRTDSCIQQDGK